jgi:hypothetical protein
VELFEDVWEIALDPAGTAPPLPSELEAKVRARYRDTQFARARREVLCTVQEVQVLLRIFTAAASAYALNGESHRLRRAGDGSRHVIDALRKASHA